MDLVNLFENKSILLERHLDVVEALRKYKDNPDIYIHFTDIPKVGINPQSKYSTPLGIYVYPLTQMWKSIETDRIPFASDRKYIQVIEDVSGIAVDVSEISAVSYELIKPECEKIYNEFVGRYDPDDNGTFREFVSQSDENSNSKTAGGKLWNLTRNLANLIAKQNFRPGRDNAPSVWNTILRKVGYEVITDKKGMGIIHGNEPYQAVFLTSRAIRHVEMLANIRRPKPLKVIELYQFIDLYKVVQGDRPSGMDDDGLTPATKDLMRRYALLEWDNILKNGESEHFTINQDKFYSDLRETSFVMFAEYVMKWDTRFIPKYVSLCKANKLFSEKRDAEILVELFKRTIGLNGTLYFYAHGAAMIGKETMAFLVGNLGDDIRKEIAKFLTNRLIKMAMVAKTDDEVKHVMNDKLWKPLTKIVPKEELIAQVKKALGA